MSSIISPTAVKRSLSNGISVLVSGAGVGGLYTALECWRRGCDIRILERTKSNVTTGDSFTIGPSALNSFKHWPWMQERTKEIGYQPMAARHSHTGERITEPFEFAEMLGIKVPIYRQSRPKFHNMLLEQMTAVGLNIEYGNEVVDYFEDEARGRGGVVLKDGSQHEADLVVAADGLRGNSWQLVAGKPVLARSSGEAIYRVAYPVEIALADPLIAERFPLQPDGRSVIELWNGPGITATFWRNEDEMSWAITHTDTGSASESWGNRVKPEMVLELTASIPGWPEVANRVIMATPPDQLVDWKLMWRDPQPKWTSPGGRVIQLGDAGHTFLPTSGNGGTQAMEDALSLAACLTMAGDKAHVPDATRVHNLLRFERVSCLQAFGVENRQKQRDSAKDGVGNDVAKIKAKMPRLGRWILAHDPESYAIENYEQAIGHLKNGLTFKNTNVPPGLVYRPWTIEGLLDAQAKGEPTILDGDWS